MVAKLQQRVDNRLSSRALEAWLDRYQEQKARQQVGCWIPKAFVACAILQMISSHPAVLLLC